LGNPRDSLEKPGVFYEWKNQRGEKTLEVKVQNDQIENAIKSLKRQLMRDGIMKELKNRRSYEKPSVKKKRKQREARRRRQKAARRFER
jgi:small subunit ribosomal protein S21